MPAVSPLMLAANVHRRYGCDCAVLGSVWVSERIGDGRPWIGRVWVIELLGHRTAARCYAWGVPSEGLRGFDCVTMLEEGAVDSPAAAVRFHLERTRT